MGKLLQAAIQRLSAISFEFMDKPIRDSHHALVRQYFSRVNAFLNQTGVEIERYPIFSVGKVLHKTVGVQLLHVCPQLDAWNNPYMKAICYAYLEVCALADEHVEEAAPYVDLYEPVIELLEQGIQFTIRQGELLLGDSAYPLDYWRSLDLGR
ncbi:hypothetical protein B5M42_013130 [Paenibacillus athensensis]|uniref:Uncharacterized protein n=1 Tax=Paenibacillus athensensis TaxID=1967502 RepID=A0A4Y8Q8D2_9BACL|nr:hypothetical protein [Paenibacillus athensensis]MCD1259778.1 hypothetical protein [Paenibacillus athensensis]